MTSAFATSIIHTAAVACSSLAALGTVASVGVALALPPLVIVGLAAVAGLALLIVFRSLPRVWALYVVTILTTYALPWGIIVLGQSLAKFLQPQATMGFPDESEPNLRVAIIVTSGSLASWVVICAAAVREFWLLANGHASQQASNDAKPPRMGP